jgi:hypothetical protein
MSVEHIQLNRGTSAQLFKLPKEMIDYLWERIDVAKEKKINVKKHLAGHISHSYKLEDPQNLIIENLFNVVYNQVDNPMMHNFINRELESTYIKVGIHPTLEMKPCLNGLWVNFQKKGEFQPIHNHSSLFSFVIWMDIPYHWKDEAAVLSSHPATPPNFSGDPGGNFSFMYSNDNSRSVSDYIIPMSPEMNGACCFFPSDLCHQVYPFYTSDKERISISGNIIFKIPAPEPQQVPFIVSNT